MKQIEIKITDRQGLKDFNYPWRQPAGPRTGQDLSPQLLRSLLRNKLKQSFENLVLVGNPFRHPQLDKILKISGELHIQTRAIQVNPGVSLKKWIEPLQKNQFDYLIFYLAGADATANDRVLGAGAFASFKRNLALARKNNLNVEVNYLITSANYKALAEIIELAATNQFSLVFSEAMPLGDLARRKKLMPSPPAISSFWEALVNWKSLNPELNYINGFSNYRDNQPSCRYAEIIFLNAAGQFQKCWLDEYFPQGKNDPQQACCQTCFHWPSRRPPLPASPSALTRADQKLLREALAAFNQLQQQPSPTLGSSLAAGYILPDGSLKPGQLTKLTRSYRLIKAMQGLTTDWLDFYRRREFNNHLVLNSSSQLRYPGFQKPAGSSKQAPSFAQLTKSLQELRQQGIRSVTLTGGDILLYPSLNRLFGLLKKQEQTAAAMLDGWNFNRRKQQLLAAPITYYLFEVFGALADTHDQLVGRPHSHEKIMDALEYLLDPGEEPLPRTGLCYLLTKSNYQEVGQMLEFASMLEIDFFILPAEQKFPNLAARFKPTAQMIKQVKTLCRDYVCKNGVTRPRVIDLSDINPVTYPF